MQWNPGAGVGICDEVNDICNSDNNSYPLLSKARRTNSALDRFFTLAHKAARPGTVDDINQTTVPIQTISISSGTGRYGLDTFTSELDSFIRFELTDSTGATHVLKRVFLEDITDTLPNYKSTNGVSSEYLIIGKYIELKPAPNFTGTLTAYFERNKVSFTSASTTTSPGIPTKFSTYLCRLIALPHLIETQKAQKNDIAQLIQQDEVEISLHYLTREKGLHRTLRVASQDNQ